MRIHDFSLMLFAFFVLFSALQSAVGMDLIAHALRSDEVVRCVEF